MPARRNRAKGGSTNSRRFGTRPAGIRPTLPVVTVVCDDQRTAVAYFQCLKQRIKQKLTLNVVRKPHPAASTDEVVDRAVNELRSLQEVQSHDEEDQTIVWALIDTEADAATQDAAQRAKEKAEKVSVRVALSNPCYEIWTLLHLVDTGELFQNCKAVVDRLKQAWQKEFGESFDRKAEADCSKIIEIRTTAAARARKHQENNDPSWTEVYRVIEDIHAHLNHPA